MARRTAAERDRDLLLPYNPWWGTGTLGRLRPPAFRRPVFSRVRDDLDRLPQYLVLAGPRRVGKTTLIHQLIEDLLAGGIAPERITYYSFDDPALERQGVHGGDLLDRRLRQAAAAVGGEPHFLFLDEIQRLDRWELHLKKAYDLGYSARMVLSGSASSPIFRKSRESLLGRVKDYRLLPFSFREFVLARHPELVAVAQRGHECGRLAEAVLTEDPRLAVRNVEVALPDKAERPAIDGALAQYLLEGGFPEVWDLPTWVAKQEYLFDNQVKKVIYEDLLLAAEFRKPELLTRFYISLLERPGREVNIQAVAGETGIGAQQIEKYLPLLELTDLVYHLSKFRKSALRVRRGRVKFYLVDLALRNAVLRLTDRLLEDPDTLGLYAENLVFLALRKWPGAIQMDYYRDRDGEVDFIVHVGERRFLPVEVKYREQIRPADAAGLRRFSERRRTGLPLLVTKRWEDFGAGEGHFRLPLALFLLMFD